MKNWLIAGLMFFGAVSGRAQNKNLAEGGCATVTTPQEMQMIKDYLSSNSAAQKTTNVVDSVPLSIHIVSKTDGSGRYFLDHLLSVLCDLNTRYAPIGFYFYVRWPIHYINNSSFYDHNYTAGYQMMNQNNVANTANIYFVNDPNGACGYYSPAQGADAIAISKGCAGPNSTTVTHELGHYFGLPHTFFGWENGNIPSNPEKVTRGAGANCSSAGDGFCDTDADYLSARWNCPYTGNKLDQTGVPYHPDSSLYMGYSDDACMSRFSLQQKGAMQFKLANSRGYLLQSHATGASVLDTLRMIYPTDTLFLNRRLAVWHKVPGAEYYFVSITSGNSLTPRQDTIVADTTLIIDAPMNYNVKYRITVAPLSSVNVCRATGIKIDFYNTGSTTSVNDLGATTGAIEVFPNPAHQSATIKVMQVPSGSYRISVLNLSGQEVYTQTLQHAGGETNMSIPTAQLANGLYLLRFVGDASNLTEKLLIQH